MILEIQCSSVKVLIKKDNHLYLEQFKGNWKEQSSVFSCIHVILSSYSNVPTNCEIQNSFTNTWFIYKNIILQWNFAQDYNTLNTFSF